MKWRQYTLSQPNNQPLISVADEPSKLAKLRDIRSDIRGRICANDTGG